jgi:hypothetical protein
MEEVHGQCSCGAIGYKFSAKSLIAYQCHCSICRKATGSAFSTTLLVPERAFTWLRGEKGISSYAKENGYKVNFCSCCGSPVPNKFRDFSLLCVPVGSIDGAPHIDVAVQLYLGSRAQWDSDTLTGRQFHEMPRLDEVLEFLGVHGQR